MRRVAVVLVALLTVGLSQGPASAGGWWTSIDLADQYVGTGESLSVKVDEVLFGSIEAAERAEHTQYFAYLVTEFDQRALARATSRANPKDWWEPTGPVFQAGRVTLLGRDANLTGGRVDMTVPDVPPGRYSLMLCDSGCRTPLANHIPVPIYVMSDLVAARAVGRLGQANERLRLGLARVRRDVWRTQRQLQQVEGSALEDTDTAAAPQQEPATGREPAAPSWTPYAGWFLAGVAVALIFVQRRRNMMLDDLIIEHAPDDPRELTKTPTSG